METNSSPQAEAVYTWTQLSNNALVCIKELGLLVLSYPSITFNMLLLTESVSGPFESHPFPCLIAFTFVRSKRGKKSWTEADNNGQARVLRGYLLYVHTLLFFATTVRQLFLFLSWGNYSEQLGASAKVTVEEHSRIGLHTSSSLALLFFPAEQRAGEASFKCLTPFFFFSPHNGLFTSVLGLAS